MGHRSHVETEQECFVHEGGVTTEPHFGGPGKKKGSRSGQSNGASRSQIHVEKEHEDMSTVTLEDGPQTTIIIDELVGENGLHWDGPPPMLVQPLVSEPIEPCTLTELVTRSRVLPRLLAMADSYRNAGSLHSAVEIYFELIREHAQTPEALQAEERLIEVAQYHERVGESRQARGIYEQLL
jgi:hypothetical protein